jgi:hypothetical protein
MKTVLKHGMILVFASSVILCAVFWTILSALIGH